MPHGLLEWATLAGIVITCTSIVGGAIYSVVRAHINRVVEEKVAAKVDEAVEGISAAIVSAVAPLDAKIDGVRLNQSNLSEELSQVKVQGVQLEAKLENGIKHRLDAVELGVNTLVAAHLEPLS